MNEPIISEELPQSLRHALDSYELRNDNDTDPTKEIRLEFQAAQCEAIRRFCYAINPKAIQLMESVHINNWEACQVAALEILRDEICPPSSE